jgi:hypothetical protein
MKFEIIAPAFVEGTLDTIETTNKQEALEKAEEKITIGAFPEDQSLTIYYDGEELENFFSQKFREFLDSEIDTARAELKVKEVV